MPWPHLPELPGLLQRDREQMEEALDESLPEFLRKVYLYAEALRGPDEAKELWLKTAKTTTKAKKGRGKHGKRKRYLDIDRDGFLLREYNRASKALGEEKAKGLPRVLGKVLDRVAPGRYGPDAETIMRHIRRLRNEQKKRRARFTTILGGGS